MAVKSLLEICAECGLPVREVPSGCPILEEGKASGALFILREGAVEIRKQDVELNRVSAPGAIFGEVSLFIHSTPMATVATLRDSSFYVAEDGAGFLEAHPEVNYHIALLLANRLTAVTSYLVDLKHQFASHEDHLGMVDEVLESLLHHQARKGPA